MENNTKTNQEKINDLKKIGLDGLYELILTQNEQINRLYGAVGMLLEGDYTEANKILWGINDGDLQES